MPSFSPMKIFPYDEHLKNPVKMISKTIAKANFTLRHNFYGSNNV